MFKKKLNHKYILIWTSQLHKDIMEATGENWMSIKLLDDIK